MKWRNIADSATNIHFIKRLNSLWTIIVCAFKINKDVSEMVAKNKDKKGFFNAIVQFFKDMKAEVKRITWNKKKDNKSITE